MSKVIDKIRNVVLLLLLTFNVAVNYVIFIHITSLDAEIQAIKLYLDRNSAILLHTNRLILGQYSSVATAMEIEQLIIDREDLIKRSQLKDGLEQPTY